MNCGASAQAGPFFELVSISVPIEPLELSLVHFWLILALSGCRHHDRPPLQSRHRVISRPESGGKAAVIPHS